MVSSIWPLPSLPPMMSLLARPGPAKGVSDMPPTAPPVDPWVLLDRLTKAQMDYAEVAKIQARAGEKQA